MNLTNFKIAFVGCVEAGYFCAEQLIKNGLHPAAIVCVNMVTAQKNKVSGYKDFFDIDYDCERYRPCHYSLTTKEDMDFFESHAFDILVVLGWQRLIPAEIIGSLGICGLTIHGSGEGLPKGRGRSPMNWAIIDGHDTFHLSLLTLAPGADGGEILDTLAFDILPTDTIRTLYYKNALVSSRLLVKNIPLILSGSEYGEIQDETEATYYPKRTPDDGRIDWNVSAMEIEKLVRATTKPYPGAFTHTGKGKMLIGGAQFFDGKIAGSEAVGTVAAVFPDGAFTVMSKDCYVLVYDYDGAVPEEGEKLT